MRKSKLLFVPNVSSAMFTALAVLAVNAGLATPLRAAPTAYVHVSSASFAHDSSTFTNNGNYDSGQLVQQGTSFSAMGSQVGTFNVFTDADAGNLHARAATSGRGDTQTGAGTGSVQADFQDNLHITSATLAAGAPAEFQLGIHLDYLIQSNDARANANRHARTDWTIRDLDGGGFVHFIADEGWNEPQQPNTYSGLFDTAVGHTVRVTGILLTETSDSGLFGGAPSNSLVDASNTAAFSFAPVANTFGYSTDLGANYVPEPAFAGLAAGLLLLLRRGRKQGRAQKERTERNLFFAPRRL